MKSVIRTLRLASGLVLLTFVVMHLANLALGVHLFHGVWSLFQSLGWSHPRFNKWRRHLAGGLASVIVLGNISFPVLVLCKVVEVHS